MKKFFLIPFILPFFTGISAYPRAAAYVREKEASAGRVGYFLTVIANYGNDYGGYAGKTGVSYGAAGVKKTAESRGGTYGKTTNKNCGKNYGRAETAAENGGEYRGYHRGEHTGGDCAEIYGGENYGETLGGGMRDARLKAIMDNEEDGLKNRAERDKPAKPENEKKFIKWCEFNVPFDALEYAMEADIRSRKNAVNADIRLRGNAGNVKTQPHKNGGNADMRSDKGAVRADIRPHKNTVNAGAQSNKNGGNGSSGKYGSVDAGGNGRIDWIELLALLAVKNYGNFSNYRRGDIERIATHMREGKSLENLKSGKNYGYYKDVFQAVLGGYLGYYRIIRPDGTVSDKRYGLRVFSPIAAGYGYSHYDDFGDSRSFGYKRRHLGHDMMGAVGTPVIAVEGGVVAEIGWNRFGGWRIGIMSGGNNNGGGSVNTENNGDGYEGGRRYYYYAHLRKDRPYAAEFKKGDAVQAGDVIGYLGMTGYSDKENVDNIKPPHLHFGLQLIFDESQIKGAGEIWADVYALCRLLHRNRSETVFDAEKNTRVRKYRYEFID
ncbi:MAG: M23 family metallopeptidase [Clostridiales bacterium]|jgi:murein DD-endopeptidase MepM/ murein hydrolase activator NlpD|nr:M23 family metallopeptidase [Clostridiales bacterium]